MQLLLSTIAVLLSFNSALALPTSPASETSSRALHPCAIDIQRWCNVGPGGCSEPFDTTYYNAYPTTPFHWAIRQWWGQTSLDINTPSVGSELVPIQVGSNILHITNVADASPAFPYGKFSFVWGSQHWDDFSPGNPCDHAAAYTQSDGLDASIHTECRYQCDK